MRYALVRGSSPFRKAYGEGKRPHGRFEFMRYSEIAASSSQMIVVFSMRALIIEGSASWFINLRKIGFCVGERCFLMSVNYDG